MSECETPLDQFIQNDVGWICKSTSNFFNSLYGCYNAYASENKIQKAKDGKGFMRDGKPFGLCMLCDGYSIEVGCLLHDSDGNIEKNGPFISVNLDFNKIKNWFYLRDRLVDINLKSKSIDDIFSVRDGYI